MKTTNLSPIRRIIHVIEKIQLDQSLSIKEDSRISRVKAIVKGDKIRNVERLVNEHPLQNGSSSSKKDWLKMRGTAIIVDEADGSEGKGEVHWYECKNIGKVEFKLKRWL